MFERSCERFQTKRIMACIAIKKQKKDISNKAKQIFLEMMRSEEISLGSI